MELPAAFAEDMKRYYPEQATALLDALRQPAVRAARLQKYTLAKNLPSNGDGCETNWVGRPAGPSFWLQDGPLPQAPLELQSHFQQPVPWLQDAYYILTDSDLGRTAFHELGGVYLQDASAMAAVAALNLQPGERVLDLCAAPGSKATALGRLLAPTGSLYANEIHPVRVKVLAQNLERCGIPAVISNERPETLAQAWPQAFDAVLVDAPCSGEGMFRKDPDAALQWTPQAVEMCALRQRDILKDGLALVRPGGRLVYSTCTLNPLENEQVVAWACANFPVELEELPLWPHWEQGRPELAGNYGDVCKSRRLWPHSRGGEGHFVARLRVLDTIPPATLPRRQTGQAVLSRLNQKRSPGWQPRRGADGDSQRELRQWAAQLGTFVNLETLDHVRAITARHGGLLLSVNDGLPLEGLKVLREGVWLARIYGQRLVPHHQLAMASNSTVWLQHRPLDEEEIVAYLRGEALGMSVGYDSTGWVVLSYQGLPAGWGKATPGRINNGYPKGLRRQVTAH